MADAIPVHSAPKKTKKVQAAVGPQFNQDGLQLPPDYATVVRDGLGDPAQFDGSNDVKTKVVTELEIARINAEGEKVSEVFTHKATRVDH